MGRMGYTEEYCGFSKEEYELRERKISRRGKAEEYEPGHSYKHTYKSNAAYDGAYSLVLYPNGEFGIGLLPSRRKSKRDSEFDRDKIGGRQFIEHPRIYLLEDGRTITDGTDLVKLPEDPFNLDIASESSQRRMKYGLKGITGHGKKMLRNGGHLIDKACKRNSRAFAQMGTLTIPSLCPDSMRAIATHWSRITQRFFQECKRLYKKMGFAFHFVSATEIQPGRWIERGEVGLHIHFIYISYRLKPGEWSMDDNWVRATWIRILESYISDTESIKSVSFRREKVNKSSAAYISKYASKGSEFIKEVVAEMGEEYVPSQWWSISSDLRKSVIRLVIRTRGDLAWALVDACCHEDKSMIRFYRVAYARESHYGVCTETGSEGYERIYGYGGQCTYEVLIATYGKDYEKMMSVSISHYI